jgi:hypothetical protein
VIAGCAVVIIVVLLLSTIMYANRRSPSLPPLPARTATPTVPQDSARKPYGVAVGGTLDNLSEAQLDSELENLSGLGVQWIRIDVAWPEVQPMNGSQFDWSNMDRIIAATKAYHLKVLGTLAYTPSWAAQKNCNDDTEKCAPANDSTFANFAASAVRRYNGNGINAWEIWNEPNNQGFWLPSPDPAVYTQLLKLSYAAIKGVDPSATVLSGSLGPVDGLPASIQPVTFLSGMYADGARNYFDIVGYHPYSYPDLPSTVAQWSGWSMMSDLSPSIRSVMVANGDAAKQIWITEYGAPTGGPGPAEMSITYGLLPGTSHVDDQLQAEMLTQSTRLYVNYVWLGNYFWYSYKDLGTDTVNPGDFFGLLTYNGNQKPAYATFKQVIQGYQ